MKNLRFSIITLISFLFAGTAFSSVCTTASNVTPREALSQSPVSGSFAAESFSGDPECVGPDGQADAWYRFTANSTKMFVRVSGTGDLDLALEVVNSCGGAVLACENNSGSAGIETASLSGLTIGNTYYFRTYHVGAAPAISQSFTVAVSFIPLVELRPELCGISDYTTNDILKSTQPSYSTPLVYYQWRFEELEAPFNVYERIALVPTNPNYRLKWLGEIAYNRSYSVSVRIAVNPGSTVGEYGPACIIQLQEDVLTTQLEDQYANGIFDFCDVVGADPVGGADRYRWEFFDFTNTLNVYGDNSQRLLRLSKVPGLRRGQTYIVKVFAEVEGMESPAGENSFLTINNAVPNTGLRNDFYPCGATYPINSQVQAVEICRAQNYTWRFRNTSQPQADLIYTRTDGSRFIRLEWVTGLIPGDNYNVDVKARQGFKNGDYSAVCNITVGASTSGFVGEVYALYDDEEYIDHDPNNDIYYEVELASEIELVVMNNGSAASEGIVFDISSSDVNSDTRLELYDLNGRLIADRTEYVVREGNRITWKIPGFTSGIYLLRAVNGENVVTKKVSVF
ncbi:T9SS type A sorting domain-containing protein [Cryomorpha ignava]|uniref:T9SS type A sorting domain-containing protein n=1 Tax=Cryomorpha ignava TaxID=101383 RepID=A0A7K3WU27_9FLAO|nr:T9SS type A sorting domain-containing protein [Cryomorpha ignava]NEN25187.1 T9SS type A sorting domain-containing protein [Cryomorpha ignava]